MSKAGRLIASSQPRTVRDPKLMRQVYRRQQVFVLCFALGIAAIGLYSLINPLPKQLDITLGSLPDWLRHLWYLLYIASGLALSMGILRANPRLEAMGHALITTLFAGSTYLELVNVPDAGQALSGAIFTILLTCGSAARFLLLIRYQPATSDRHGP